MINNYYTLFHLAADLKLRSHGMALGQPFTQVRSELILPFEPLAAGLEPFVAVVSCEPSNNFLFIKNEYPRAKRNTGDMFSGLEGGVIDGVLMHPSDREMRISLRSGSSLAIQFFGSRANVLLIDPHGTVSESFLRHKENVGVTLPPLPKQLSPESTKTSVSMALESIPSGTVTSSLKRAFPGFGNLLIREVLHRSGIDGSIPIGEQPKGILDSLRNIAIRLQSELLTAPTPGIYYRESQPEEFVIIPLQHLESLKFEPQPTVSDGVRKFISSTQRRSNFTKEKGRILGAIRGELEQAASTVGKVRAELPKGAVAETYERYGKLLQANLYSLKKGEDETVLEDHISPGHDPVAIPMDKHLSPAKNAERYFEKAKKIRSTIAEQQERLKSLDRTLKSLTPLAEQLDEVESDEDLKEYLHVNAAALRSAGITVTVAERKKEEDRPPFRVYEVDGGFQVWAGKSGENNDLLTTRHTAKNDLWFHARGVGGSHVVLKSGTGTGQFTRKAILQAAAIAAHYSKMKKASHVPVTMCEGKHVRKPKGAPTGTVTVEHEEVLYVTPKLPGEK